MPIYAYRCSSCSHAKDVLRKLSDPVLTQCPACGAETFTKQVTAAGFQLKGSGWYVTDFKGGAAAAKPEGGDKGDKPAEKSDSGDKPKADKPADKGSGGAATAATPATPAAAPAPAATPASQA